MDDVLNNMGQIKKEIHGFGQEKLQKLQYIDFLEKSVLNLLQRIQSPDTKYPMETNIDDYININNIQNLFGLNINQFKVP